MKKLKKIKLNIEKDVISSLSIDDQLQIKGGTYLGGHEGGGGQTGCNVCSRSCTFGGCGTASCGGGCNGAASVQACGGGGTGGAGQTGRGCVTYGCPSPTQNCAPTGSAVSEANGYNCYTIYTMCDC